MNKSIDKFQSCCNSFKSNKILEKRVNKNLLKIKNNTKYISIKKSPGIYNFPAHLKNKISKNCKK